MSKEVSYMHYVVYDTTLIPSLEFVSRDKNLCALSVHDLINASKDLPLTIGGVSSYYLKAGTVVKGFNGFLKV